MMDFADFQATLRRFRDLDKLMLIDLIADSLDDEGAADELIAGLAVAFERAEEAYGLVNGCYPAGNYNPGVWAKWRKDRDRQLAYRMGRVAA